ncbi:MAG: hypothetical protein WD448_13630 [Woeseia sp.]
MSLYTLGNMARNMLCLLVLTAALWLFHMYGRTLPTAALVAVWAALTAAIAAALFWRSRIRRRAFLAAYIAPASPLQRWLRGGWLLGLRQVLLGSVLALVLAVALVRLDSIGIWIVLIGLAPALVLVERLLRRSLAMHVSRSYLPELTWRLSLLMVGVVVVVLLVVLAFHQAHPDFSGVNLERAVWHLVDQEQARSPAGYTLLQMAAATEGLRLWLAQQLMPQPGASLLQLLGWLLVLAEEALFVWSYLLVCNAVLIGVSADDRARG